MSLISIASTIAIVLGFAGTLPHIATMLQTRSSGGQAPLGWVFGITVNVMTGYVNLVGLGATMLGVGNVLAGAFNGIALALVLRYGRAEQAAAGAQQPAAAPAPRGYFHELPTGEFDAIKSLIDEEHARRESFRVDGHELHDVRELVAA
jgi:hypothetical protein